MRDREEGLKINLFHFLVALMLSAASMQASAQQVLPEKQGADASSVAPGYYATEQGWGWLVVESAKNGSTRFSVESQSTPMGSCGGLEGVLKGNIGTVHDGKDVCTIRFNPTANGLALKAETVEACRQFCGLNGSFDGEYLRDANPACMSAAVEETRGRFKKLYDRKDYRSAQSTLQPVLKNCTSLLTELDLGPIRNDLALTQYKNGQREECLATLTPYQKDAGRSDKAILQDWGRPDVADEYLAIVKAARTNLRLCGVSKKVGRRRKGAD